MLPGVRDAVRRPARDLAADSGTFGHVALVRWTGVGRFMDAPPIPLDKIRASGDMAPTSPDL